MNNIDQFSTDFLSTTSNYLTGASTVFNLAGNFYDYNRSESEIEADCMALRNDFNMIGKDLEKSIETTLKSK